MWLYLRLLLMINCTAHRHRSSATSGRAPNKLCNWSDFRSRFHWFSVSCSIAWSAFWNISLGISCRIICIIRTQFSSCFLAAVGRAALAAAPELKRSAPWAGPALGNSKSAQISQCLSRRGRLSPAQPCPARRRRRQRWRTPAEATSSKCVSQRPRLFFCTTHSDDDYLYLLLCMSLSRATHPSSESPSAQPVHLCESPGR